MKRIFILFGVLALAIGAQAQYNQKSNYISFNVNGGMNSMLYNPANGDNALALGFGGGLRYTHFFGRHFGIGFGAQYNYANASTLYDFTDVTVGLTHDDNPGVTYDLHTSFDKWRERQNLRYLGIPVELYWRAPMGERWFFLFGLGAQFDLPLHGEYNATEGSYRNEGYFPAIGHMVSDMPDHGFRTYKAEDVEGSEFTVAQWGISLIADLGFNYALSNHWGLYFGIYGGYGLTNLLDSVSTDPIVLINEEDASKLDYNGTFGSDQIDALHLLNFGVKLGVNFGWNCHSGSKADKDSDLVSYDDQKAKKEQADKEKAEKEKAAKEKAAKEKAEKEKAAKQQNETPATNDNNQAANQQPAGNAAYGNNGADEAEEAAAREARCNARRMNDADMAQALANIDADIQDAEAMANESGNAEAKAAVADAKAKAADAKRAHKNGQYCKAYDLFNEAYGRIADSYANDAATFAGKNNAPEAKQAADDAALYADASHRDGLDCAMAASRNARLNSEIARNSEGGRGNNTAYMDPNYADYLANEALAMANDADCAAAKTDAKDSSGKAYRGQLAPSYAASAKSFAESADCYAKKCNNPDSKAAAKEANTKAAEAAEASRMGDIAAAYRAARAAQQAAERARRACGGADNAAKANEPAAKPADRTQLQKYLDQINATVHFDFAKTEPKFDSKTDLAIRALVAAMKADKNVKILITGHTDNVGSAEGNMTYGKKRAEALKQLMVDLGAPAASISTASKGQTEPVVENDTEEHRYQNRRAVITLR
ncbi:MAG: OmpA family protein [Bacteroidales bacterium]|nr:OmpA family protein [Bacteroidales bacterium]